MGKYMNTVFTIYIHLVHILLQSRRCHVSIYAGRLINVFEAGRPWINVLLIIQRDGCIIVYVGRKSPPGRLSCLLTPLWSAIHMDGCGGKVPFWHARRGTKHIQQATSHWNVVCGRQMWILAKNAHCCTTFNEDNKHGWTSGHRQHHINKECSRHTEMVQKTLRAGSHWNTPVCVQPLSHCWWSKT